MMFYRIFLSPQVKRSVIISNKHDVYETPNGLSLGSYEIRKYHENVIEVYFIEPSAKSSPKVKILSRLAKKSLNIETEPFPQCAISHEN